MLDRVIAGTIPRVAEQRRRRVRTAERRVVAHIDPGPRGVGLALGQHRHGRVVAVQTRSRQHVGRNQVVQRPQRHRTRAHLVGQRRQAEIDALSRVAIPLPVERLVLPVLLEQDHGQQVRARPAARHRVERRRRLRDLLAAPAGELLAHRLDDLPPARDRLQRLRHILADLRQPFRSAALTGRGRRHHHTLARKVVGERLARRLAADEPLDLGARGRRLLSRQLVLCRARRELIEGELQLAEQALTALRPPPVERATELLDHQRQRGNLRFRVGRLGLGRRRSGLGCRERRLERSSVVRIGGGHGRKRITSAVSRQFLAGPSRPGHRLAQLNRPATAARSEPGCASRCLRAGSRAVPQ